MMNELRTIPLAFLFGCLSAPDKPEDSGDTGETAVSTCPGTLEELCEYEFGGACPTFEEAAAMLCDGVHLGDGTEEPNVDEDGDDACLNPKVSCYVDIEEYSRFYFHEVTHELQGVSAHWPDTDECPGMRDFGELWC